MFKNLLKGFLLFVLAISFMGISNPVKAADEKTEVWFFYSNGCAHCAHSEPVLDQMVEDNDLDLVKLELSTSLENQEKFLIMSEVYQHEPGGVPTVLINDQWIEGFDALAYRNALKDCLAVDSCSRPSDLYNAWFNDPANEEKIASLKNVVPPEEQESQLWYSIGFIVVVLMIGGIIWLNVKKN
jgi:thiol-disulfide isomerase/thioredoxin